MGAHFAYGGWEATGVGEGSAEEEFYLGVGAAEVVRGPSGQGVVHHWIQPEQDLLAFGGHRLAHW